MDFTGKRVYIETYGCQQNEADSETIAGITRSMGFVAAESVEDADLIIVNTCAVREHAELKALSNTGRLKHLKEINPGLKIGVCGCMVQQERRREDLKMRYPYVDFVFGTNMFEKVEDIIREVYKGRKRILETESYDDNPGTLCQGLPVSRKYDYKAYLPIMSGCNNFCTYCVVPYVRGRERSKSPESVIGEFRDLANGGCREITLLGQNVNSYGKDLGMTEAFAQLIRDLDSVPGDFWIRFMTSHPKDASDQLIEALAESKKCARHFHLPLQSGSNEILKRMNRRYGIEKYLGLLDKLRDAIPGISVTSDIIVGFPGETEEDFRNTLEAMKTARFDNVFSFVYSPRPNTPAAVMPDQIPDPVKKERMQRLLELQQQICLEINSDYVGRSVKALCEGPSKTDERTLSARSSTGKLIHFTPSDDGIDLTGRFVKLKITKAMPIMLFAEYEETLP